MKIPLEHRLSERGMTLVEVLVSILLLSLVMVAFLGMLDTFSAVAKTQGDIADSTENLRFSVDALVRLTRMAGTGGLPLSYDSGAGLVPLAVVTQDNVPSGTSFGGRQVLANTDVLRVRGVITGNLYDIGAGAFPSSPANTLYVPDVSPFNARPQDLMFPDHPGGLPILIMLQVPFDLQPATGGIRRYSAFRVVEVVNDSSVVLNTGVTPNRMEITYKTNGTTVGLNPNGAWAAFDTSFTYSAGFLDDMVFFVSLNDGGEPALYRAVSPFLASPPAAQELVPNISNLQLALGCDMDRSGEVEAGEWINPGATGDQVAALTEVRLSIVARSQDPDLSYITDVVMPENAVAPSGTELNFRYRVVTVRIGLRSHPPLTNS